MNSESVRRQHLSGHPSTRKFIIVPTKVPTSNSSVMDNNNLTSGSGLLPGVSESEALDQGAGGAISLKFHSMRSVRGEKRWKCICNADAWCSLFIYDFLFHIVLFPDKFNGGLSTAPEESMAVSNPTMTVLQPQMEAIIAPDHGVHLKSQLTQVNLPAAMGRISSYVFSDTNISSGKLISDPSIRSLASIGIGSTDGRRMIIRRVPTSPSELMNIMNPQT